MTAAPPGPRSGPTAVPNRSPRAFPDAEAPDDGDAARRGAPTDARLAAPAVAAWGSAAVALGWRPAVAVAGGALLLVLGVLAVWRWDRRLGAGVLAAAAACLAAGVRLAATGAGPVPELAAEGAIVDSTMTITSDPVVRSGRFGDVVVVEARIGDVTGRGDSARVRSPVLVIGDDAWRDLRLGSVVRAVGRLDASDDARFAAVFLPSRLVELVAEPAWWWRLSDRLRAGVAEGVATTPGDARALVPALVDGDDRAIPDDLDESFRACGLTHLLAVSGTNLTLVLAFVLALTRRLGVRGYAQIAVGALVTVGFVLLARPEPSVLRSAAMGVVAIAGLGAGSRGRGLRALAIAVVVLVLVDPWLARSIGFTLSVLATGGILMLAPGWTAALSSWLPRPVAEAVAVPLAAQLVCTPVIAVVSGRVSLVAVVANVLAAPAVGPATVLGLLGGLVALVWEGMAHLIGWGAAGAAWWVIAVAERGSALPGASVGWSTDTAALAGLTALCGAVAFAASRLLRHRALTLVVGALGVAWIVHPLTSAWPPTGWVLVACDVGQGDALVLNAGHRAAVVVDTGPDPSLVDRCLDDLDIATVALVVLTHPHADHIDGLTGVGRDRPIGGLAVAPGCLEQPTYADVAAWAAGHRVPVQELGYGSRGSVGGLTWTVLGPTPELAEAGASPDTANDASVVLSVRTRGVRLLLTGDVEPPAQDALLRWGAPALRADVLKVPHHGSANQDLDFLHVVHAQLAVVSVGADNDYGHPAAATLRALRTGGATVVRTDLSGDVAVVVRTGEVVVATH